jgi:hypothetical protein
LIRLGNIGLVKVIGVIGSKSAAGSLKVIRSSANQRPPSIVSMSTARDSDNVCVSAAMTLLAIDSGCGLARKQRHCECGCASYSAARRSRANSRSSTSDHVSAPSEQPYSDSADTDRSVRGVPDAELDTPTCTLMLHVVV